MDVFLQTGHTGLRFAASIDSKKKGLAQLVVLCPGFLDSKDYPHLTTLSRELVDCGYAVVRFNPQGTWVAQDDLSHYSTTAYLDNISRVVKAADRYNSSAFSGIIFVGHSMGGLMSLFAAASQKRTVAVVAIMPPIKQTLLKPEKLLDWKILGHRDFHRESEEKNSKTMVFSVPFTFMEDAEKYDARMIAQKVTVPTLLIASKADEVIAPKDVKVIYKFLQNEKNHMEILEGIDHNYRRYAKQIEKVNGVVLEFLEKLAP